ncbi:hybrid signal transduction histidine kinase E-like [Sitodiplosis mosellana]|uniref:hybrid signal transduction histidine kinase E-like n=1 Tax=Sitodiplosis mosellana TaxID=263140 RepID=UPI0024449080|nr:hybrid signal transduction histidine kinase E-like [Sitodiplosis mosellana]
MACDIITENLIKGIIVTHSRTGITLQQISNIYYECVGERWSLLKGGEEHAIRYLDQIEGILSIVNEKHETVWYVRGKTFHGEKCGQIYRANSQTKSDFDLSTNPHGNGRNTCNQYSNNNNGNNNNFRNARYTTTKNSSNNNNNNNKGKVDRKNNVYNGDINGNYDSRKQSKYNTNNRMRVNGHSSGSSINNDSGGSGYSSSSSNEQKTSASMYGYDLVGDDFFMEMAKIDLGCSITNRKHLQRSGLCISGQRIRDATERLKRFPNTDNMKIIANLGTVDILHGRDLTDMCQDYIDLVKICAHRRIQIVITTLAPIGNRLHLPEDVKKFNDFNGFLLTKFGIKHQVINITACMVNEKTGKVWFDTCYQPTPKYVSGSDKPHLLWNRIGRQRIYKAIKARLRF